MGNSDTYRVVATITGEYEDDPRFTFTEVDFLAPGQPEGPAMADLMRCAALKVAPEGGNARSDIAIFATLDARRAEILRQGYGPATSRILLGQLWEIARGLNLEWYGVGKDQEA